MTTEILSQEVHKKINWSIPQWVISETGLIVFTNGTHDGNLFEGILLPNIDSTIGSYGNWVKSFFKPIPEEGLVIKIKNN